MHKLDMSDTPYMGTLPSYGHTGAKSARERRGKYRANARRKPSWRHNEELDILMMTTPRNLRTQYAKVEGRRIAQPKARADAPQHVSATGVTHQLYY